MNQQKPYKDIVRTPSGPVKIGKVYLIPSGLHADAPTTTDLALLAALRECTAYYVEAPREARRFLKSVWKEIDIDAAEWHTIHNEEEEHVADFANDLLAGKTIGIISDAGCPGIADPGQLLVRKAQAIGAIVKPLVGPSSILLALMASGLEGQRFRFSGYLPIGRPERKEALLALEKESGKLNQTEIFIETPYRNDAVMDEILRSCRPSTLLCVATDLTAPTESVQTKKIAEWTKTKKEIGKRPTIFLLLAHAPS